MMMTNVRRNHRSNGGTRAGLSGLLFLLFCCLPAWAGAVGTTDNDNSNSNGIASSPADDITSLPVVADSSGITLVGSAADLRGLELTIQGEGRIDVVELPRGGFAVTFVGSYRIDMDRNALALGRVGVLFRGGNRFTDGRARLQLGGSTSAFLAPRRLPLPVGRLAQVPAVLGNFLTLDLFGPNADRAHVAAYYDSERVTLYQRIQ